MATRPVAATSRNRWITCVIACGLAACDQASSPATPVSAPDLELVSSGNEPRQLLRYHAPAGTTQKLSVSIGVELTADEMGGPMPTIVVTIGYGVETVMPSGQLVLRATIEEVKAVDTPNSKVPAAALNTPLATLQGLAIFSVLSADGRVTATAIDRGSRTLTADMAQQLDSLVTSFESTMMALPDVPVGVGAVWRNSRPVEQNGLKLKAVNSVSLTAIKGDVIEYSLDTDIHGADQHITANDISIEVKDIVGNGGGKGSIDLGKLAITSELAAEFRSEMSATGDPKPTKMQMTTLMKVQPL